MKDQEWNELIEALRGKDDVDRAITAARTLHTAATAEDLPRLMDLLNTDNNFFVRESAALPACALAGPAALPELLKALQRGFDEGHDHDGFQAALADLVQANRADARVVLTRLAISSDSATRENAAWLLEYCENASDT